MTRFVNVIIATFFVANTWCLANANENMGYKEARVELDPQAEGGDGVLVVNKATEFGVQKPYNKYALFQENQSSYFHAALVTFKGKNIKINGWKLRERYVYDVYTYWRNGELLLLALRYEEPEFRSQYKYFMNRTNGWQEVDGELFKADRNGLISVENLTKLLEWIEEKNAPKPEQLRKKDTTRRTIVLVSVVLAVVAVLLLVAVLLFLKR